MIQVPYNRNAATAYARRWALGRNPAYFDFQGIGGDCTNFVSQCVYAGAKVMNYTPDVGWFYRSPDDRAAAWTGVDYLYRFLLQNQSVGPYGIEVPLRAVFPGDIIQLGNENGEYYHTLLVMSAAPHITVSAHSMDALNRSLASYQYGRIRCVHIVGVRNW